MPTEFRLNIEVTNKGISDYKKGGESNVEFLRAERPEW